MNDNIDHQRHQLHQLHPWAAHVVIDKSSFNSAEYDAIVSAMDYMWSIPEEQAKIRLAGALAKPRRIEYNILTEISFGDPSNVSDLADSQEQQYDYVNQFSPEKIVITRAFPSVAETEQQSVASAFVEQNVIHFGYGALVAGDDVGRHYIPELHAVLSHEFMHLVDSVFMLPPEIFYSDHLHESKNMAIENPVVWSDVYTGSKHYKQQFMLTSYSARDDNRDDDEYASNNKNAPMADISASNLEARPYRIPNMDETIHYQHAPTDFYKELLQNKDSMDAQVEDALQARQNVLRNAGCNTPPPFPVFNEDLKDLAQKHPDLAVFMSLEDVSEEKIGGLAVSMVRNTLAACKEPKSTR